MLGILAAGGWVAISDAATHLLDRPRDGRLDKLVSHNSLADLFVAGTELQRTFHVGHATSFEISDASVRIRHDALLGRPPMPSESLFLAAVQRHVIAMCTGFAPSLSVTLDEGRIVDPAVEFASGVNCRRLAYWEFGSIDVIAGSATDVAPRVEDLVARDPSRTWRVEDVAQRLAISQRTLQRSLHAEGTTFRNCVRTTRLVIARSLVERTDLSIGSISAATGFADHAHLARCFRAAFGTSPSRARAATLGPTR